MTRARLARAVAFVLLLITLGATALVYYQDRIADYVIRQVEQSSGLKLSAARSWLRLSTHLVIVFEDARAADAKGELFRSRTAQLLFSYHALIWRGGLPLYAVVLDHPELRIELPRPTAAIESAAPLGAPAIATLKFYLARLSATVRKIRILEAKLSDPVRGAAVEHLDLFASRKRRRRSPWRVSFDATCKLPQFRTFGVKGDLKFGTDGDQPGRTLGHGELWAWSGGAESLRLGSLALGGLKVKLAVALRNDGQLTASGNLAMPQLVLSAAMLKAPLSLTDCSADFGLAASQDRLELKWGRVQHQGRLLLAGEGYLNRFVAPEASFGLQLGGLEVNAAQLQSLSSLFRDPPRWLRTLRMEAGRISLDEVALAATRKELESSWPALANKVVIDARLSGVELSAPSVPELPPIDSFDAKLGLARGVLTLTQVSARLGKTVFSRTSARVDFSKNWRGGSYQVRTTAEADLPGLSRAAEALLKGSSYEPSRYLGKIDGAAGVTATAAGDFSTSQWIAPANYEVEIQPQAVQMRIKALPRDLSLIGGTGTLRTGVVTLDHVRLAAERGEASLTGSLRFDHARLGTAGLSVELKGVPVEDWSALAIDPDSLIINGPANGKVEVRREAAGPGGYSYQGIVNIGPGQLKLGFLRAPISMSEAVLQLTGKGVELRLPDARLEGSKFDFKLAIDNLREPSLKIEARAADLDLEAMKFIRMPWAPKRPIDFFGHMKASGRVEAQRGRLAKLAMTDLTTDFVRDKHGWRVYNLSANTLAGKMDLEVKGRARDDWIGFKGHAAAVDVAALLGLTGANRQMLDGNLFSDFDLWADTGQQFFNTLSGKCSIVVKHGTLRKFAILSRMLSMIDLKNWLTAQLPDPLLSGVPFSALTGEFLGEQGSFYTDNLLLEGPVMDISAIGNLGVGQSTMDMQVAMFPFQTVNWLVNKIPIVGQNISKNSGGILAAYFRVHGPMKNPSVRPAPITSLTELIKKTLGLPLNIIRPQTIR